MAELIFLNALTCNRQVKAIGSYVNINGKNGGIRITQDAVDKMHLKDNESVQVVLHGNNAYLLPRFEGGFSTRAPYGSKDKGRLLQAKVLAQKILKHFGMEEESSYRFKLNDKSDLKGHEVYELRKSILD